jgi:hypothetical protein
MIHHWQEPYTNHKNLVVKQLIEPSKRPSNEFPSRRLNLQNKHDVFNFIIISKIIPFLLFEFLGPLENKNMLRMKLVKAFCSAILAGKTERLLVVFNGKYCPPYSRLGKDRSVPDCHNLL